MKKHTVIRALHDKINERNKLASQVFPADSFLVLNGAGGGIACAAFVSTAKHADIVVDQTLYWTVTRSEEEAWYRVGVMNTDALTAATRPFNPQGELGPRHLHTLPNRLIAPFNPESAEHTRIALLARELAVIARSLASEDPRISDSTKPIAQRRRRLRNLLKQDAAFPALEKAVAQFIIP